jgi:hypothetical protein
MMDTTAQENQSLKRLFERVCGTVVLSNPQADRDKSGSLSRREVRHLVRRIFRQEHREDFDTQYLSKYANMAFKEHDKDGNHSLDFDEFVSLYKQIMNDVQVPAQLKRKATFSLLKRSFHF